MTHLRSKFLWMVSLVWVVSGAPFTSSAEDGLKDPACVKRCGEELASCRDQAKGDARKSLGECGVQQELIESLLVCVASGGSAPVCIARVGISTLRIVECTERTLDAYNSALERCLETNKQCVNTCPVKS